MSERTKTSDNESGGSKRKNANARPPVDTVVDGAPKSIPQLAQDVSSADHTVSNRLREQAEAQRELDRYDEKMRACRLRHVAKLHTATLAVENARLAHLNAIHAAQDKLKEHLHACESWRTGTTIEAPVEPVVARTPWPCVSCGHAPSEHNNEAAATCARYVRPERKEPSPYVDDIDDVMRHLGKQHTEDIEPIPVFEPIQRTHTSPYSKALTPTEETRRYQESRTHQTQATQATNTESTPMTYKPPSRCTGHCCRLFPLPLGPEELEWRQDSFDDGPQIAEMVTYEGMHEVVTEVGRVPFGQEMHHYSCRYHDKTTGNCDIYEYRPDMCVRHPGYGRGQPCQHQECTHHNPEDELVRIIRREAPAS